MHSRVLFLLLKMYPWSKWDLVWANGIGTAVISSINCMAIWFMTLEPAVSVKEDNN